jgi:hypothetical protein
MLRWQPAAGIESVGHSAEIMIEFVAERLYTFPPLETVAILALGCGA